MIYYFSATGNSLWVAQKLSDAFEESICAITDTIQEQEESETVPPLREDEKIFFVFPVHSWGPAVLMKRFIKHIRLTRYNNQEIYVVCTCGDDCGYTDRIVRKDLKKQGIRLTAFFSICMPNNYILMKGFDTDSKTVEHNKIASSSEYIEQIINAIRNKDFSIRLYQRARFSWIKTYIIYPLFIHFVIKKQRFLATEKCIACGICEQICPTRTITMENKHPIWRSDSCVQCTACIHRCPTRAIEFGNITKKKGRYIHPILNKKQNSL